MKPTCLLVLPLLAPLLSHARPASAQASPGGSLRTGRPDVPNRAAQPLAIHWWDADADGDADALWLAADGSPRLRLVDARGELAPIADPELAPLAGCRALAPGAPGELFTLLPEGTVRWWRRAGEGFVERTPGSGLEWLEGVVDLRRVDVDGDGTGELELAFTDGRVELWRLRGEAYHGTEIVPAPAAVRSGAVPADVRREAEPAARTSRSAPSLPVREAETSRRRDAARSPLESRHGDPVAAPEPSSAGPAAVEVIEQLQAPVSCAAELRDQAGGPCLVASSVPTPGALLPLGDELFVDTNGSVGIGTQSPDATLHVKDFNATLRLSSINPFTQYTELALSSIGNFLEGMRLRADAAGLGISATTEDRFGNVGTFGPHLFVGLEESARIGIATDDPLTTLDVQGTGNFIQLWLHSQSGNRTVDLDGWDASGEGSRLSMGLADGATTVVLDAEAGSNAAELSLRDRDGTETVELVSQEASGNGAQLALRKGNGVTTVELDAELGGAAQLSMFTGTGQETVELVPEESAGDGAQLALRNAAGISTFLVDAQVTSGAELNMKDSAGQETVEILSEEALGDGAQIVLRTSAGRESIVLDADQAGEGRITTDVLEITGGADLAEGFEAPAECSPGSVVVIDPERPGALALSREPYDRRVAGVVSGAGGVKPGLRLGQANVLDGNVSVALTGRVFARCSAENGAIESGDLLTTGALPGTAMRATDTYRSNGAVLGKAMGSLEAGEGLVVVLVNLQ